MTKILIVGCDDAGTAHLRECLTDLGYLVSGAVGGAREALEHIRHARPSVALVDLGLDADGTAIEVGTRIGSMCAAPVVYLADAADAGVVDLLQQAAATGTCGYLLRPFAAPQLHLAIRTAQTAHMRERPQRATQVELQKRIDSLEDLNYRMQAVFDSMNEGVVAVGENHEPLFHNTSARRICDNLLEGDVNKWVRTCEVLRPDGETRLAAEESPLALALRGIATDDAELFIRNDQKREGVHVCVSGKPLMGTAGEPRGAVLVFRDITGLKRAEGELENTMAKLRNQNELIDTAFKSISDGIVVANAKGEFLYVNPAAEQIVGIGITDRPQEEWAETYGTYYADRETPIPTEELPLLRAIFRGESVDEEDLFIRNANRPDGVYIRVSARPLLNAVGGVRGGVIVFRDVTAHVFAAEALTQAFAEGRLEIVDTILHNIGNAITSVTTGIETVRRNLLNDRVGRQLADLAAAIDQHRDDWLAYLRDDPQGRQVLPFILALSTAAAKRNAEWIKTVNRVRDRALHIADIVRTEKASSSMDRKDIDLQEALGDAVRELSDSLVKRGIRTSIDCQRGPRAIRIRDSQFHQMLVNLIKNAIEAIDDLAAERGSAGTPYIRICAYSGEKYLHLEIADSGIGIRTKDTRMLFAPGYTTKPSGSGLGLHSAANFVIATGGRIEPVSEGEAKGTTMRVLLPLSSVVPAAPSRGAT